MHIADYCQLAYRTAARLFAFLFVCMVSAAPSAASDKGMEPVWQAFREGTAFAIMRHAIAPGMGDPANFKLDDCSTQRNLSNAGREQARKTGDLFRSNGIDDAFIFTSQWCRCRETARLLAIGPVRDLPSLNSFFQDFERRNPQTLEVKAWIQSRPTGKPLILVTHQVNISALTGTGTQSGEILFAKPVADGQYTVLGRIVP